MLPRTGRATFVALIVFAVAEATPVAGAAAPSSRAAESFVPCALRGLTRPPMNTLVSDESGQPIARLSGAELTLTVSGFSTASASRARIETGTGRGGFRVRGFVDSTSIVISTRVALPIVGGHLSIAPRTSVQVVQATPERLKVEKRVTAPLKQTFSAWAPCVALSLGEGVSGVWTPPGNARGYVLRGPALDLYERPGGSVVTVLRKAPEAPGVLFFSTERTSDWVHIEYRGEILVDAWTKSSALDELPRGETMDQLRGGSSVRNPARLAVQGEPRVVRPQRDVPLRTTAKDSAPSVGVIEAGAEVYVMDVVVGWVSVLPRPLDVVPVEGGQFWVKRSELGI